ncbi:uncharacterized protein (TIGR02302 family) [Azospirillum fermentarium]|uniref:TIGR02302 family protein n=1 Tax=Azospirillum fermentarium TaxID=1233114 RepID=UPI002227742A|nr:TIGR02302 family protein [Azospirillum fermentarium]MCW2247128.1 uncharacterized protein (TIGR02302 family) [Azospirillum fermentarium]
MTKTPAPPTPPAEPRGALARARAALVWEALWPGLWAAAAVGVLFTAAALSDVLPRLPGWLHLAVLILFAVGFVAALALGLRRVRLPGRDEARRRLERDSGLPHRPLNTLRDRPSGGDPMAAALWALHQERVRARVTRLRVALPHPNVAARDPLGLRMAALLLLFAAGAGTWGGWEPRLRAAVSPRLDGGAVIRAAVLDLWITPPAYTGQAPVFLKPDTPGPVTVPAGSKLLARVAGGLGTPSLTIDGAADGGSRPFAAVDGDTHQIERELAAGTRLTVTQGGRTLGSWPLAVVPDAAPIIAFVTPPAATERGMMRVEFAARDDHGLAKAGVLVTLQDRAGEPAVELPLPLGGSAPKEAHAASTHDLTAHPWAGLPVWVQLVATDGAGQIGLSDTMDFVLPEREFRHPVARAIIEQRRILTRSPATQREPVANALSEISATPGTYNGDIVVFLSLRAAVARLVFDDTADAIPALQTLLWEIAVRIEDGGLSLAQRDVRDAQNRLAEALDRNASDAELRQLMDELQQAMDRLMQAMEQNLRQALERGEKIPEVPPELAQQMMDAGDLQRMMDQMRSLAETGARDAARQMLSQLQQMMESMQMGAMQPPSGQNEALNAMRQLQDLAKQQQGLLDQTFRQSQEGMDGGANPSASGMPAPGGQSQGGQSPRTRGAGRQGNSASPLMQKQAEQQEQLRRQLGEVMRQLGEQAGDIPAPLGRAERAMRDAREALQRGQPGGAVQPQTEAMDNIQQGLQTLAEQMMQQMMASPGMGMARQPMNRMGQGRDPLGRRSNSMGQGLGEDVKVPTEAEVQRAREILDELRRRSGQFSRPQPEREYIDRLLRPF